MKKFIKKGLALALAVIMLMSLLTVSASAATAEGSFTDIADSPYSQAIQQLAKAGIMNGVGGGKFAPDQATTRAMAITVLGRMAKVTPKDTDRFNDVVKGTWYSGYVGWAEENGIVEGVGGGRFEPQRVITGEEMGLILERYAKLAGIDYTTSNTSKAALTRGEMAEMVYTVYKLLNPPVVIDPTVPIAVEGGQITGTLTADSEIAMWKGIPYAAAPVGDLRWKAPQDVESWSGVKACTKFGPSAMQNFQAAAAPYTAEFLIEDFDNMSEDCLTLNVWAPAGSADGLLPVIFYIHGGGFTSGGASCEIYDGELMARQDVVYVSINYRLGIFGFMAHPELSAEDEHGSSGNYALLDWIKALEWVQEYIAEFGGDPDNVTIVGQSAGGMAVNTLTTSPLAKGLFAKAFSMSGITGVGDWTTSLASAEQAGVAMCEELGKTLEELRAMPAEELLKVNGGNGGTVVDGYALVGSIADALKNGTGSDVPMMVGMVGGDPNTFGGVLSLGRYRNGMTASEYQSLVRSNFGEYADRVLALYPATDDNALDMAKQINIDSMFTGQLNYAEAKAARSTNPVYLYVDKWDYAGQANQGPFHSSDIAYWLGGVFSAEQSTWSEHDYELADIMSGYLLNFAKTGNVNGTGLPQWNAYSSRDLSYVAIGDTVKGSAYSKEMQALWADYRANPPEVQPDEQPAGPNSATITWEDAMSTNTGTLTIDPATSEWSIVFNSAFGEYFISGTYDEKYTLTVVDDGGLGGFLDLEPIQTVAGPAIEKMLHSRQISWTDAMSDCTGTLTIYPATSGWEVLFNSAFGEYFISGTYDKDFVLTVTNDGGLGGFLDLPPLQAVAGSAIQEILYTRQITWQDAMSTNTGTLTIDPATSEWNIVFNSAFGEYFISGTYAADGTLTVIDDGGLGGFLDLEPIQAVAGPAILDMLS